ncbi:hypothetical protein AB0J86_26315 [Micromonospora sp. NPDC049559]|uniref:hypothetical protein n=1 Tax=Micromonospora sp. NPDC049559 TaxID=3155923 RepID=UPI00343A6DE2
MPYQPGDVVVVDGRASVQFADDRAIVLRIVRVPDWETYHGWCWLTGYVLDRRGDAVERRDVFVQPAGLRLAGKRPAGRRPAQP